MNREVDALLEQSISQMAEGKARVESCLLAYPSHADELRPLLLAAEEMLVAPKPALSDAAKARIEAQLFEAAAASGLVRRERKPLRLPRLSSLFVLPKWRWAYSALAALVIAVLLMTSLVGSANALPGSPFYPVKLATEEVWLWVVPARDEPSLHLRFARRRLAEYQELAQKGVYDEAVLDAMVAQVDAALEDVEDLPPAVALPLLDEAAEVLAEEREVLAGMLADMPAESRPHVQKILGDTLVQVARVGKLRLALQYNETGATPELSLTDIPASTPEPTVTVTATATVTLELTLETPQVAPTDATVEIGTTEEPLPTGVTPTATLVPSVPTETEVPPTPTPEEVKPTKETPPGQTKTPQPPGLMTRTPSP